MTPSFYKFRHDTIKNYRKEFKPYLLHGRGRIRYSNNWMDYERAKRDFDSDWFRLRYHRDYYRKMKNLSLAGKNLKPNERWVEVLFGTTPYGKLVGKFVSKIKP